MNLILFAASIPVIGLFFFLLVDFALFLYSFFRAAILGPQQIVSASRQGTTLAKEPVLERYAADLVKSK